MDFKRTLQRQSSGIIKSNKKWPQQSSRPRAHLHSTLHHLTAVVIITTQSPEESEAQRHVFPEGSLKREAVEAVGGWAGFSEGRGTAKMRVGRWGRGQ